MIKTISSYLTSDGKTYKDADEAYESELNNIMEILSGIFESYIDENYEQSFKELEHYKTLKLAFIYALIMYEEPTNDAVQALKQAKSLHKFRDDEGV